MQFILILSIIALLFMTWAWLVRPSNTTAEADLRLAHPLERMNGPALVAIQPWLLQQHYQSADHLLTRLNDYLQTARDEGSMPEGSIVVFPEHVGTWLVAAGAPGRGFTSSSTDSAMIWLVVRHPLQFVRAFLRSPETDRAAAAIFRMRANAMAADYSSVFGQLAARFNVTVVAGSIVLPEPEVRGGILVPGTGSGISRLYNASAVFYGDGHLDENLVRKVHPIPDEAGFTAAAAATPSSVPVFETAFGRLGVMICADSWHPDVYAALASQNVDIIAVPAFLQPDDVWEAPWHGYTTGWPDDADQADELRLTEGEAWLRYALAGRMKEAGAQIGVTAFLRGTLWDLGSDGANILVTPEEARVVGDLSAASISAMELVRAPE